MPKSLIICCDGTWNRPDQGGGPTNVTKMARAIIPKNKKGEPQIVYYDEGVGTGNSVDRWLGGAFGIGLGDNVQQAYRFLALNYEAGDQILMFGFSRGAYTVRSLAGLVSLVGLLRKGDLDQMPRVWTYYRTPPNDQRIDFIDARMVAAKPEIDLMGVWDTVGALGIPGNIFGRIGRRRHEFHNVKLGSKIRRAYQALAIDEHRKLYSPAVWDTSRKLEGQTVEQAWFAGAHSNVGGGYPDPILSDQAFMWMISKAQPLLDFDEDYLERRVERLADDQAKGLLMDPSTGWMGALGRIDREIGKDKSEVVHPSAVARYRCREDGSASYQPYPYDPGNLIAYLTSIGALQCDDAEDKDKQTAA
jgi:uncharacterized protein (DUF2235 family)